jgi:hypothetical protein
VLTPRLLCVLRGVLCFSALFDLHVAELLGVKDLATLQALDILGVFVPGNDTYPWVLADGCHCFGVGSIKSSFRQIVAVFSTILNGYLLKLCSFVQISWPQGEGPSQTGPPLTPGPAFARLRVAACSVETSGLVYRAEVAELADARGSGPRTRKGVGVRVPSSAPEISVPKESITYKPSNNRSAVPAW